MHRPIVATCLYVYFMDYSVHVNDGDGNTGDLGNYEPKFAGMIAEVVLEILTIRLNKGDDSMGLVIK